MTFLVQKEMFRDILLSNRVKLLLIPGSNFYKYHSEAKTRYMSNCSKEMKIGNKRLLHNLTSHWMVIDVFNCKRTGVNFISLLVRNFQLKLFLKSHHNLHSI